MTKKYVKYMLLYYIIVIYYVKINYYFYNGFNKEEVNIFV